MTKPEQDHVAVRLGHSATRSDVLRALLLTALDDAERDIEQFKARRLARRTD